MNDEVGFNLFFLTTLGKGENVIRGLLESLYCEGNRMMP